MPPEVPSGAKNSKKKKKKKKTRRLLQKIKIVHGVQVETIYTEPGQSDIFSVYNSDCANSNISRNMNLFGSGLVRMVLEGTYFKFTQMDYPG